MQLSAEESQALLPTQNEDGSPMSDYGDIDYRKLLNDQSQFRDKDAIQQEVLEHWQALDR
eukprot:gene28146-37297_t